MSCCSIPIQQVPLEDFVPYVAPFAKGAPDELIAHEVRVAAIELARATLCVERTLAVDLQAGVANYCLDSDDPCINIMAVRKVCIGQNEPHGTGVDFNNGASEDFLPGMLTKELRPLRERPCQTCPWPMYAFWLDGLTDVYISPVPQCDYPAGMHVTVQVTPGQDCCFVPRIMYDQYAETIADGAIYRMLLMKGAPWYDLQTASIFIKKFADGKRHAKTMAMRGNITQGQKLRSRRWV